MAERWKIEQPEQLAFGEDVRRLRLNAIGGRINVLGVDGPATLEVSRVSGPPLTVDLTEGALVIKHGEESLLRNGLLDWLTRGARQEVELSLSIPPDVPVEVAVFSGPVVLSNLHARIELRSVSGEVTLAGIYGPTAVSTVSGAVTVEQSTDDLSVRAVSGSITVLAGSGGKIDLNTVAGAITLDLEDPLPPLVTTGCVSGSLTVRLPHDPDVSVELGSFSGHPTSQFAEVAASRKPGRSRLSGQVGAGRSRLTGHTASGAITLLRRDGDEEPVEDERPDHGNDERIEDAR